MKLSPEQRTKLFKLVRNLLKNKDKIIVVSSDHPNKALIYMDDNYIMSLFCNENGVGVTTNNVMMISLHERKRNWYLKFDTGDYIFMKNRMEFEDFYLDINQLFLKDVTDNWNTNVVDEILNGKN